MKKNNLLLPARHTVIEQTAAQLAAVFYEAGRSSGLTSDYKDARSFARAKFIIFIPRAIEILLSMLNRSDIHDLQKQEIFLALQERMNDPDVNQVLPNYNAMEIMKFLPKSEPKPVIINTSRFKPTEH